jgi:hypothetical protein
MNNINALNVISPSAALADSAERVVDITAALQRMINLSFGVSCSWQGNG